MELGVQKSGQWVSTSKPPTPKYSSDRTVAMHGRYRGLHNTGVLPGTTLSPASLAIILDVDGTVIDGADIIGALVVLASNCTIRNTRIRGNSDYDFAVDVRENTSGNIFEDCTIDGGEASAATIGGFGGGYTMRRCNISGGDDSIKLASNTVIEDCYIHDPYITPGSHSDVMQLTGGSNIIVRRNHISAWYYQTNDFCNAAMMHGSPQGDLDTYRVTDNYLDGGNFILHGGTDWTGYNITNVYFGNNRFGRHKTYGTVNPDMYLNAVWDDDNIFDDTGEKVKN